MIRLVQALAVVTVLVGVAVPAVAQEEAALCLRVQADPGMDLTDARAVQEGIGTGEILVTDVVACGAVTAPLPSPTQPSEAGTGAWVVGPIEVDPVTGDRRAQASLVAESGTVWYGDPYTLTITCDRGLTELRVTWLWDLGPERIVEVDTRIGDQEFTTETWLNDGQATSYGRDEATFIASLFGETRLAQQVVVPDTGVAVAEFDISGIENAVSNVREACGW